MEWLTNWFFDLLYALQKTICYIIDFIRQIFYTLAGIQPVKVNGKETDLLTNFITTNAVKKSFLYIFLIACILLIVFVLIAIIRSEYANENKKNKGIILGNAFKSFITFLIVPFVLIAGITLSNVVVSSINTSMNPYVIETGETATIGGQMLVTSGYYAYIGDPDIREQVEHDFVVGKLDYFNRSEVQKYYKIRDIDFFVGIIGGLAILVMFVMASIQFVQRIFDIVLLFLISPVSVSTIPVDDGGRFRLWKEMTISKVLGAYGIILSMNLFFIIMPQVQQIMFFADKFKNGIVQILFLIGGAFAVTKANLVIAQLTGNNAGGQETAQLIANMRTGRSIARAVGTTAVAVGGMAIGGKNFYDGKNSTGKLSGGFSNSFHSPTGKSILGSADIERTKAEKFGKLPTRIMSMPVGIVKDIATGGLLGATKNIKPRFENLVHGKTLFNHPQIKTPKSTKEGKDDENNS